MKILITGASSGMGKSMALYFLKNNHTVYAVSRNKEKLDSIYSKYEDNIITLEYDLSKEENCYKLYDATHKENIDILINNAGFGDSGNFTETSLSKELDMINVNIKAYHILTKLFLKEFIARNYGRILNVASMAGFMPGPYMACYYATKAYILNLSLAIHQELLNEHSRVKISIFCPGPVATNFESTAKVKFNISLLNKDYAAKYALDNMFKDKLIIVPPNMKLNKLLVKLSPISLTLLVNSHIQERKEY